MLRDQLLRYPSMAATKAQYQAPWIVSYLPHMSSYDNLQNKTIAEPIHDWYLLSFNEMFSVTTLQDCRAQP